jgi:hypothetical protein
MNPRLLPNALEPLEQSGKLRPEARPTVKACFLENKLRRLRQATKLTPMHIGKLAEYE